MDRRFYSGVEKLLVATDCIIFGYDLGQLKLLLFKRKVEPFKNEWSLPGSFVKEKESVSKAAERVLAETTGLTGVFMKEMGCYGDAVRDPGARVISMVYFALIQLGDREENLTASHEARWFDVDKIPELILDHNKMVSDALIKLRRKARYEPLGFELLPEKFTIPQLKKLYDSIFQKELDRRNFRKKILAMKILEKLDEKDKTSSRKGAFLYRFDIDKYKELAAKGFNFEL